MHVLTSPVSFALTYDTDSILYSTTYPSRVQSQPAPAGTPIRRCHHLRLFCLEFEVN